MHKHGRPWPPLVLVGILSVLLASAGLWFPAGTPLPVRGQTVGPTPTSTPSESPAPTAPPTPFALPTPSPSPSPVPSPSVSPTPSPTSSPSASPTPTPTPSPAIDIHFILEPTQLPLGDLLEGHAEVINTGPEPLVGVTLQVTLPAGLGDVTVDDSNCVVSDTSVNCTIGSLTIDEAVTTTIRATVRSAATPTLSATAIATGFGEVSGVMATASASATISVSPAALRLRKEAPPEIVDGGRLTYSLTVSNPGTIPVDDVRLDDPLPAELNEVSVDDGRCRAGSSVTCALGTLGPGDSVPIMVVGTVHADAGTVLINTATAGGTAGGEPLPEVMATATTTVAGAALQLSKTADPDPVPTGEVVSYTLTLRNTGTVTVDGISLDDLLPGGVNLLPLDDEQCSAVPSPSASPTPGGPGSGSTGSGGTVHCDLGSLDPGAQTEITIQAVVTAPPGTTLENRAMATGVPSGSTLGLSPVIAIALTLGTGPQPFKPLILTKTASPDPVAVAGMLTYTLTVTNPNGVTAEGVQITEPLPKGLGDFWAVGPGPCTRAERTFTCEIGSL
ncbi:MAG: DUF7507 domain-containing protein, partial [Dehalococcoidia bacterium]